MNIHDQEHLLSEMHEDIEGIISSRNSKMIKQCTGQKKWNEEEIMVQGTLPEWKI
jgi:hypothetical protein